MTNCQEIERIVWEEGPQSAPESHLTECRSCREEARRAADLQAALHGMQSRFAVPPAELEPALIAALQRSGPLDRAREIVQHPKFWRGAAVGAAAAAAAATAAIGIIAVRRRSAAPDMVA
jgi:predicted anti-sigma-YlaC factor YlaD